jgi:hypothetical protein
VVGKRRRWCTPRPHLPQGRNKNKVGTQRKEKRKEGRVQVKNKEYKFYIINKSRKEKKKVIYFPMR